MAAALVQRAEAFTPMQLALDNVWVDYTSDSNPGGIPWMTHTTYADCLDETDGMRAPAMAGPVESWIEATITGPETIDFMWSLESTPRNTLACSVDGAVKASCAATSNARWSWASVEIPAGSHTVRWTYRQPGNIPGKALLDRVSHSRDNWSSLTSSPWIEALAGEPVAHAFTTKQPAVLWSVYYGAMPPGLTLDPYTGEVTGVPTEPGFWRPLIRIMSSNYAVYYRIGIDVKEKPTLLSALDSHGITFTTTASDGTSVWQPQARGSRDDADCIVAGLPPPVQRINPFTPGWCSLQTTVNGPDQISYWVRVANGRLGVLLDDKEYRSHGPTQTLEGWQRAWLDIPAGEHSIVWKYETYLDREPTAWLDDIRLRSEGRVFLGHEPEMTALPGGALEFTVPSAGVTGSWSVNGLPPGIEFNAASGVIRGTSSRRGVWRFRLTLLGTSGDQDKDDVFATVDTSVPAAAATDLPNSWWDTGPETGARWFGQNQITHDGTDAMSSPPAPPGSVSALTTTITGPGTLSWWWRIPEGSEGDSCSCVLDGTTSVLAEITGETAWRNESGYIPEGIHEVTWRWKTDTEGDPSIEAVVVDQVSFGP